MNPLNFPNIRQSVINQLRQIEMQQQGAGPFDAPGSIAPQQAQGIPPMPAVGTLEYLDWERKFGPQFRAMHQRPQRGLEQHLLPTRQPQQLQGWRAFNPFDQAAAAMATDVR